MFNLVINFVFRDLHKAWGQRRLDLARNAMPTAAFEEPEV